MSLLDDPLQLVIVGAIVIIFLTMGPKKIPELARAIGQAKGEFAAAAAQKPAAVGPATTFATAAGPARSDAQLIETAERLGIPTQGKTAEQISNDIVARANGTQ